MKRKLYLIVITALSVCVLGSCSSNGNNNKAETGLVAKDGEVDPKAKEVVDMVKSIFTDTDSIYSTRSEDNDEGEIDLIAKYGSKKLCNLVEQVRKIDVGKAEDKHFIADWNWLVSCYDMGLTQIDEIDATVDGNNAKAKYWLYYSGQYTLYELALIKEDGQWRIDDTKQIGNDIGSKVEQMSKYINENK